jgi:protein involved in polysaccharide export with SLBB domain
MKNFFKHKIITLFIVLYCNTALSQEIDPSLLSQLSQDQIVALRNQYYQMNASDVDVLEMPIINESVKSNIAPGVSDSNKIDGEKFGYGFISSMPTSISATGDLPLPNDYKISLRDQFTVILSGSKDAIFDMNVKLDGTILFPELGSISVVGDTFGEVKTKLKNLILQSYSGVDIDLSIKNLSAKKITIVGAVKTPGTYLVNPFSTISSALAYSGGISEMGTLREIKLIRLDGKVYFFDLYDLLIKGNREKDINIEAGDVLLIEPANQFIEILGSVKRPGIYEILSNENLEDLIDFSLGFSDQANKNNISLNILDTESSTIKQKNVKSLNHILKNVLSVGVFSYVNKDTSGIYVSGAIKEPGYYGIENNITLENLIDNIKFVDVYPWLGVLEQFDDNNLIKQTTLFNLNDPTTYKDIKLLPNSKIYFANLYNREFDISSSSLQLLNDYKLKINHKDNTYEVPVFGRYKLDSFIDLLGLDMSDVEEDATYISPLESRIIVDNYKNMEFIATKYNTVSFRSPIYDLISVRIYGAIDYPGTYTLQPNTKLEELYNLVGQFKNESFQDGIVFTRESIRDRQLESINRSKEDLEEAILLRTERGESIMNLQSLREVSRSINPENLGRIAGDFSKGSTSSLNTTLYDGDSIFVPVNPYVVNVLGEVLNPIAFEYKKGISLSSAINQSGGYKQSADKSRVYVIKANGMIKRAPRNIFVKNIKLQPGDTIIVPRRLIANGQGVEALLPLTQILSDMAFSAAAIDNLRNN